MMMRKRWLGLILFATALSAQTSRIPVVLLNGYQADCGASSTSAATFGSMESQLVADGWQVAYFDNCSVVSRQSARPSIEEVAQAFGTFLDRLGAPQVDVIAHSMGGLIVRAWLAGKQPAGGFSPPPAMRIRKAIFIASPHAGVLAIAGILGANTVDPQTVELFAGSRFLYDLATWNQRSDDLRGVDAISIAGNRGGSTGSPHSHDGTVVLTSASLDPTRTRVLPYCHADNLPSPLCDGPGIAVVTDRSHPTWRIVASFLSGTAEWLSIGSAATQDPVLSRYGGVLVDARDRLGNALPNPAPAVLSPSGSATAAVPTGDLPWNSQGVFFADYIPAGPYQVRVGGAAYPLSLRAGGHTAVTLKPGPRMDLVAPAAGKVATLSLAPGMLVAIYGSHLEDASVAFNGVTAPALFNSAVQINTLVPETLSGLASLSITNSAGRDSLNVLLEPAVPAIFTVDGSGSGTAVALHAGDSSPVSASHPARPGETVSIFLTGLGNPAQTPILQADGVPVNLVATQPLAASSGVIRVDCVVPQPAGGSRLVQLQAAAANHVSNLVTLDVEP